MRVPRVIQDAGTERALDTGRTYDLPDGLAAALVATGAADPGAAAVAVVPPRGQGLLPAARAEDAPAPPPRRRRA